MSIEERLLLTGLSATHKALEPREPERFDPSDGAVEWRGCRVTFNRDIPDDPGDWGLDYKDGPYIREIPQALAELLFEDYYDEIVEKIEEEVGDA